MPHRYYCDFCDKYIPDNKVGRRRHMNGFSHKTLREEYYRSCQDVEEFLQAEKKKNVCLMFKNKGHCTFGDRCKYSHLNPIQLNQLEQEVYWKTWKRSFPSQLITLPKRKMNAMIDSVTMKTLGLESYDTSNWNPPVIDSMVLPPSLMFPPHQDMNVDELPQWG